MHRAWGQPGYRLAAPFSANVEHSTIREQLAARQLVTIAIMVASDLPFAIMGKSRIADSVKASQYEGIVMVTVMMDAEQVTGSGCWRRSLKRDIILV